MVMRLGIGASRGVVGCVVLAAALLAGCDAAPLPETALLKPQPAPKCEPPKSAKNEGGARVASADAGKAGAPDEAARLRRLDYEAQCYRHAEMIARGRLRRLQASVEDMAQAAKIPPSPPPSSAY
jgi:hypothetical protein